MTQTNEYRSLELQARITEHFGEFKMEDGAYLWDAEEELMELRRIVNPDGTSMFYLVNHIFDGGEAVAGFQVTPKQLYAIQRLILRIDVESDGVEETDE